MPSEKFVYVEWAEKRSGEYFFVTAFLENGEWHFMERNKQDDIWHETPTTQERIQEAMEAVKVKAALLRLRKSADAK